MTHSTMTKKGQTTLPSEVRHALRLKAGDKLSYEVEGDHVTVRVHTGVKSLGGSLSSGKGKNLAFKNIRAAAAANRVSQMRKKS